MTAPEELVSTYIKIRSAIADKQEEHKVEIQSLQDKLDTISNALLDTCNSQGIDSFKTSAGSVSRSVKSRYWPSDWEVMYEFIKERNMPELLEKRVHQTNMKQYIEENPNDVPAGLQVDSKYSIRVTKPRGSK